MRRLLTASFDKGLYTNGLQQNIVFLSILLEKLGHEVIICVNHLIDECVDPPSGILIIESKEINEYKYDHILQTGFVLSNDEIDLIKEKNPKCKNVHVHYGNRMLADIEQCKWDNIAISSYRVDEIWTSPHYEIAIPYFKAYYNTQKVFKLPYIWSPKYIESHNKIWTKAGKACDYSPNKKKNIAIVEPNLNMTKNCMPSVLIVEEVLRADPNLFNELIVYCSDSIREKKYFRSWMWNLDLPKKGKITFSGRKKISSIFAHECSIVVSHHLMNALNYTHFEALYLNIPLVHNSEYIKGAGYYYPDYDIQKGSQALMDALTYHDNNLESYEEKASKVLHQFSPENPSVIAGYKKLLE
jgi:hypothetical protein